MFYFSATGNSKYIAELFCRNMKATCYSIEDKIDFTQLISSEDIVGVCYPVFGSRVPKPMREFAIKYMEALRNKKLIIFCTQMYFSGDGARAMTDVFPRNFTNVIYAEHFLMPNNICNLTILPLAGKKTIHKLLKNAQRKMEAVCEDISNGIIKKRGFNPASRALGLIQGTSWPGIEKNAKGKVWIHKECNQCKLCVSICPTKNFGCENGVIVTKNNCMLCYRCINKCPRKAISVFFRRKVKKQYTGV